MEHVLLPKYKQIYSKEKGAQYIIILLVFLYKRTLTAFNTAQVTMVDRNNYEYVPGRGKPSYLLDRRDIASSIDSDGASRIFNQTDLSVISIHDTDNWNTQNIHYSSSLYDTCSVDGKSNILSTSEQNSSQLKSCRDMCLFLNESDETSTIHSDESSILNNTYLVNTIAQQGQEVSMLSNISLMDTLRSIPICLTKDDDHNHNIQFDNCASNVFVEPENMFPPYIRLFSDNDDETEQGRLHNPSFGLFYIVYTTMEAFLPIFRFGEF